MTSVESSPRLPRPGRTVVMGILNVTPDSFSDGGLWGDPEAAIAQGLRLLADGADIIDVGGESTRPGAERASAELERQRVLPVIAGLAEAGAIVSVDTMRASVAAAALDHGATIINDVSGGLADPEIAAVAVESGAPFVAMHWRAHSARMQDLAIYDAPGGVVAAVRAELEERVDALLAAGLEASQIVLDPGLGFAKTAAHNWALLHSLESIAGLGFPLLVGASRKAFLGALLAEPDGTPRPVSEREYAGVALTLLLARAGVWGVRVHDVGASRDALAVLAAYDQGAAATGEEQHD